MLSKDAFRKDLQARIQQLANCLHIRIKLDRQIAQLRRDIGNLSELVGEEPSAELRAAMATGRPEGLTEACRDALRTFDEPASAGEITEAMLTMGFVAKDQANLLASVQTTLRRMPDVEQHEVGRKRGYKLKTDDPLLSFNPLAEHS